MGSTKFLILTFLEFQTRITEYLRSEGTYQEHCFLQIYIKLNHQTKSLIQMLLEHHQAWWWHQFPGESLTGINHILSEELFPNIQAELPLNFHFIPFPHVLPLVTREKRLTPSIAAPQEEGIHSSPAGWTSSVTSAAPCKSCPQDLPPFCSHSSWSTLRIQCPYVLMLWHPKPSPGLKVRPHQHRINQHFLDLQFLCIVGSFPFDLNF